MGTGDRANVWAALVNINGRFVIAIDDSSTTEATGDLCTSVDGPFSPWELAEDTIGKGDGRIEMPSSAASYVHTKHNADAPAVRRNKLALLMGLEGDSAWIEKEERTPMRWIGMLPYLDCL